MRYRYAGRVVAASLTVALGVGLTAGCSREGEGGADGAESGGSADGQVRIGLVQINQQAIFFNQMNEGAQEAAAAAGAELTLFNANDDPVQQNQAVSNFVQQGYDAVIVVAIDVEGIKPAIQAADQAGVDVIAVDAIIDDPAVSVQVGVDNAAAGEQIGEFVNSYADEQDIDPTIGVVGALNSYIQNLRKDSFADTVQAAGAEVVQTVDGENTQEGAATAAENLLTAQQDMNIIYATGEPALLGTVAAVQSQGAQDRVTVFGWDLTSQAIDGIDAGYVAGVVQQDPRTEGVEAVDAAVALAAGEQVDERIDVPVTIVTRDNVDPYREIFQ
ncbi:sugar ABC transporter substrate-binding protein [Streptomyces sp. 8K308]|uniref:substrate-binding domain-containing protein n=1 Tax=Streptomyces sp. 8K308 TaxID=2530388 RepID=UPI00104B4D6E|nr:substrate-binding domain-containing protein [Streptomyces sp. 8K308]TDC27175.1 sugar ABC transporter substrate-binding protein [Streptomyces sp. 8K308]